MIIESMDSSKTTYHDVPDREPAPQVEQPADTNRGRVRVKGDSLNVDVLKQPLTLPFSGLVAPNRLMKAPMTERLCHWNKYGEELVRDAKH